LAECGPILVGGRQPQRHSVRVAAERKLKQPHPTVAFGASGRHRLPPEHVERQVAVHGAQGMQFGDGPRHLQRQHARLRSRQRPEPLQFVRQFHPLDPLADDEPAGLVLLQHPGAAQHRIDRLVGGLGPPHDLAPHVQLPATAAAQQHQADDPSRGFVARLEQLPFTVTVVPLEQPVIGDEERSWVPAHEPLRLPARDHAAAHQPPRQGRERVVRLAAGDVRRLAAQIRGGSAVDQAAGDEEPPKLIDAGRRS
jgi:hypothetical protein